MNFRRFAKNNILSVSIVIFLSIFFLVERLKPGFLYTKDGSIRPFGLGYRNKTVVPYWFFVILVAILSYVAVLYFSSYNRILIS